MKPMLKCHFQPLVSSLRAKGIAPRMEWSNVGEVSHLIWEHDGENYRHPVYLTTSGNAYNYRKRYDAWVSDVDPLNEEVTPMTPTDAVRLMYHTLTGLIAQSKKPGFYSCPAYADIRTTFDKRIEVECEDWAVKVWLANLLCFWYSGDQTFAEVNQPKADRLAHIIGTGWLPSSEAGAEIQMSTLFELHWNSPCEVTIIKEEGDKTFGIACMTDSEGLYQVEFEWEGDQGELAHSVDLPVIISITGGRFVLPYELVLTDCEPLEAIQELDDVLGWSAQIVNGYYATQWDCE